METIAANGSCIQRPWCHIVQYPKSLFKLKDPQLLCTHQHSLNNANAASVMNRKGDRVVMSKPVEMKRKLNL